MRTQPFMLPTTAWQKGYRGNGLSKYWDCYYWETWPHTLNRYMTYIHKFETLFCMYIMERDLQVHIMKLFMCALGHLCFVVFMSFKFYDIGEIKLSHPQIYLYCICVQYNKLELADNALWNLRRINTCYSTCVCYKKDHDCVMRMCTATLFSLYVLTFWGNVVEKYLRGRNSNRVPW